MIFIEAISRILVQGQGGAEVQPAGILKYSEELKRGPNTEIGTKDIFEIASKDAVRAVRTIAGFHQRSRGKSEHHRAGCSITWSRGNVKESATERIPPRFRAG